MKPIRLATLALLLLALATPALAAQPPRDDWRPEESRDHDRYDDDRYDDDRDDDRYDDDRDRDYDRDSSRSPRHAVGFFYDELSPYGDWILTRDHGWAWFPRDVRPGWRPYRDGRWVMTDYGWTWASYEPFGWATYHYGRWTRDWRFGWLWVPGNTWGPAWVSWQSGGGYVGWAPLPPSANFEIGFGIRFGGLAVNFGLQPDAYSFVPERSFLSSRLSSYLMEPARNATIFRSTQDRTRYDSVADRVVNRGVDVGLIEKVTGKRVPRLRVTDTAGKARSEVAETVVRIHRAGQQQLESVRLDPRTNLGLREQAPNTIQNRRQPGIEDRNEKEPAVAPRLERAPGHDERKAARDEQRKQAELKQYQLDEKRRLEKAHQLEIAKAKVESVRGEVQLRQKAEREAQQLEQKKTTEQLAARLKAQRQAQRQAAAAAAKAGQPVPRDGKKAEKPPVPPTPRDGKKVKPVPPPKPPA